MPDSAAQDDVTAFAEFDQVPAAVLEGELAQITRSRPFRQSQRHQRFLRHLVAQTAAGNTSALKESVLACEVFGRALRTFDPAQDTIVRVEARRLRQRLDRYYGAEGRDAAVEIHLPVGSYVPLLRWRRDVHADVAATRHARDLVERGEHFLRQPLSRATLEDARARFEAALREAPRSVPALVGLARAWYNLAVGWHYEPRTAAQHANEALRRALELDGDQPIAHALLGATIHQFEFDWPAARRAFVRAVELGPRLAFVHAAYGCALLARDQLAEAEHELVLARTLDPQYGNARAHMVNLRIAQGRLDDAQAELDAILDIQPDSISANALGGVLAMVHGDAAAALALYERLCTLAPDHPNAHASLAAAQGFAGDVAAADATLAAARKHFGDDCLSPYVLAVVAARCGRPDTAIAHLAHGIDVRDPSSILLRTDPSFASLRAHPGWTALLRRLRPPSRRQSTAGH